jgi:hypothetical protein
VTLPRPRWPHLLLAALQACFRPQGGPSFRSVPPRSYHHETSLAMVVQPQARPYSLAYLFKFEVGFVCCIISSMLCKRNYISHRVSLSHISMTDRTHATSRSSPFHPVAFMSYFQSLLSLLTDDTPPPPSSNTRSSSTSISLFAAAFPSSLPNVHIPTCSPSTLTCSNSESIPLTL